jgi:hypothetical protein
MQAIFINCHEIVTPDYFTKYYNAAGESYQRLEDSIDYSSFDKDSECVMIELFRNCTGNKEVPVSVKIIHRQG